MVMCDFLAQSMLMCNFLGTVHTKVRLTFRAESKVMCQFLQASKEKNSKIYVVWGHVQHMTLILSKGKGK